jgi:hypothetical protein
MDAIISISSNWQAWAVWIGFVMLLIGLMHYFNGLVEEELCECEMIDVYDFYPNDDLYIEWQMEHMYECTKK